MLMKSSMHQLIYTFFLQEIIPEKYIRDAGFECVSEYWKPFFNEGFNM